MDEEGYSHIVDRKKEMTLSPPRNTQQTNDVIFT